MDVNTQSIFWKIREISTWYLQPRPYIAIGFLEQELQSNIALLDPYLAQLKRMRLIMFNSGTAKEIKLTQMGLYWENN